MPEIHQVAVLLTRAPHFGVHHGEKQKDAQYGANGLSGGLAKKQCHEIHQKERGERKDKVDDQDGNDYWKQ